MTTCSHASSYDAASRVDQGREEGFSGVPAGRTGRTGARVADGGHPDIAKPLHGLGSGILELALRHRGDAFRVVYAVQIDDDVWVLHAFQKESKSGIATPKAEIDLITERLKRLKEALR